MQSELELAGAASAGSFLRWRRKHALPPGAACRNCATVLQGPWCHRCGQLGEDFHRSAHHLIGEAFEGFFHADGRLVKTLPQLVWRPGRLTRSYLDGKRAPQIPPFRLFLSMLLIVFLVGSAFGGRDRLQPSAIEQRNEAKAAIASAFDDQVLHSGIPMMEWFKARLPRAIDNPAALVAGMEEWAHRFAFMTLPISALLLWALFARRPDTYLFDHLIFSMHSLSFQGLLIAAAIILGPNLGGLLLFVSPLHLFVHMRGTYGTGTAGTLVRMTLLFITSAVAFSLLLAGLVLVALNTLTG